MDGWDEEDCDDYMWEQYDDLCVVDFRNGRRDEKRPYRTGFM